MRKCDACGKAYAESKDVFCPHCGALAQKQCTHSSSFDSSMWDRGEIYGGGSNTYQYGTEPHAQRPGNAYNTQPDKSREVKKQFRDDYKSPKTTITTILEMVTKTINKNKSDEKKLVKIITVVLSAVIAIFSFISSTEEYDAESDYSSSYEDYTEFGSEYSVEVTAGEVYVEPVEDWDGTWCFDLNIKTLYMYSDESDLSNEVCNKLSGDENIYIDGVFCTMPDKIMSIDNYDEIIEEEGAYIVSETQSTDAHTVQYWFNEGDIIYCSYLMINFDDASMVNLTLPFDAFSCDEEGNVTYYACNINEVEGTVAFEETRPVVVLEEFDCMVEF